MSGDFAAALEKFLSKPRGVRLVVGMRVANRMIDRGDKFDGAIVIQPSEEIAPSSCKFKRRRTRQKLNRLWDPVEKLPKRTTNWVKTRQQTQREHMANCLDWE